MLPILPGQDSDQCDKGSLEWGCLKFSLGGLAHHLDFTSCHGQPQFYQNGENPLEMLIDPEPPLTNHPQGGRTYFPPVPITGEGV